VIDAMRAVPLGELFRPENLVNQMWARATTRPRATNKGWARTPLNPSCYIVAFLVNSEPHTEARPSVRVCGGPS
jgi:hypothetical protein